MTALDYAYLGGATLLGPVLLAAVSMFYLLAWPRIKGWTIRRKP